MSVRTADMPMRTCEMVSDTLAHNMSLFRAEGAIMLCPHCGATDTKVVDSRPSPDDMSIKRRRECLECGARFTTFERCEDEPVMIQKRDGHLEPFDRSKLTKSLITATAKRDIPLESIEDVVDSVENDIRTGYRGPVPSSTLGDTVLLKIRELDKVAYIRFASVYKDFQDLAEFNDELSKLTSGS